MKTDHANRNHLQDHVSFSQKQQQLITLDGVYPAKFSVIQKSSEKIGAKQDTQLLIPSFNATETVIQPQEMK